MVATSKRLSPALARLVLVTALAASDGTAWSADDPTPGAAAGATRGEAWPMFRGPRGAGIGRDGAGLPVAWGPRENIAWKVRMPGRAWSSPIVWGAKVFVTTAATDGELEEPRKGLYFGGNRLRPHESVFSWEVHCYDLRDGRPIWKSTAAKHKPGSSVHLKNTYASETPVTDGEHLWTYFGSAGLYCYDLDGNLVWKKDLGTFKTRYGWGTASSPVVDDERLFIQADNEGQSFVVALEKETGKQVWRMERDEGSNWATPFLWDTKQRTELVTCGSDKVRSYDPASGKLLWELGGMSNIVIPTPITAHGLLYLASGFVGDPRNRPLFAISPGAHGDLTLEPGQTSSEFIAWYQRFGGPYNPSPLVYGDHLYVLFDRGIITCHDARTGREIYKQRITRERGQFTSSPWAYDGRIFCLSESGSTFVIQAGPEFKILATNTLDEMFMSTPAISAGSLILRGINHLYCIREKPTAKK